MIRPQQQNADGTISKGTAQPLRLTENGPAIDFGLTKTQYDARTQIELQRMHEIAAWYRRWWHTHWRNAVDALYLLVSDHIDCVMANNISIFHSSNINDNEIKNATATDAANWNIDEGDRFYVFEEVLISGLNGDDAEIKNSPIEIHGITLVMLFAMLFEVGLHHSKYSSILTVASFEGCHSKLLRRIVLKQCADLSDLKYLVVWSYVKQCWCCIEHCYHSCMDWPFESAVFGLLNHSSNFFLTGICRFVNGKPEAIPFDLHVLKEIFDKNFDIKNLNVKPSQWNDIEGVFLTDSNVIRYMYSNSFAPALAALKEEEVSKGLANKWNDPAYVKKKKKRSCKSNKIICY